MLPTRQPSAKWESKAFPMHPSAAHYSSLRSVVCALKTFFRLSSRCPADPFHYNACEYNVDHTHIIITQPLLEKLAHLYSIPSDVILRPLVMGKNLADCHMIGWLFLLSFSNLAFGCLSTPSFIISWPTLV